MKNQQVDGGLQRFLWELCIVCHLYLDFKNSIIYFLLLYFNYIARNVRVVQNEKLRKLIFHYAVSLYRTFEGTSLKNCFSHLPVERQNMEDISKCNNNKTNNQIKKLDKRFKHFTKEDTQIPNKHI